MGTIIGRALVVSSQLDAIFRAHTEARRILGDRVTEMTCDGFNGERSFAVVPSGSKLGWPEARDHGAKCDRFRAVLESMRYDDGSHPLDWVEVRYGECHAEILSTHRAQKD